MTPAVALHPKTVSGSAGFQPTVGVTAVDRVFGSSHGTAGLAAYRDKAFGPTPSQAGRV